MTEPHKVWIEQCEAARVIESEFGTQTALEYLVGEKLLNCLEAAPHAKRRQWTSDPARSRAYRRR